MKILLTGGSGMVGRNILEHTDAKKHEFYSPSSNNLNLLDYSEVLRVIKQNAPDMIIHAAGLVGGIQANMSRPVDFLVKNVDMGRNIIMAAKENNVQKFMNLSSSCMYPRFGENPLKEEMILSGELEPTNEGYALAKIMSTRLCEYIHTENSLLKYKTVIPCNLYGRHDKFNPSHSHMVPAVIKRVHEAQLEGKETIEIWGDGQARREFMYSEDLADFIFFAIDHFSTMPQNINVGLGRDYTINEYYQTIAEVTGYKGKFKHDLSKPVGMKQKLVDDSKLQKFGWQHKTSLKQGIKETLEYYKSTLVYD